MVNSTFDVMPKCWQFPASAAPGCARRAQARRLGGGAHAQAAPLHAAWGGRRGLRGASNLGGVAAIAWFFEGAMHRNWADLALVLKGAHAEAGAVEAAGQLGSRERG